VKTGREQFQMAPHSIHCSFLFCKRHSIYMTESNNATFQIHQHDIQINQFHSYQNATQLVYNNSIFNLLLQVFYKLAL